MTINERLHEIIEKIKKGGYVSLDPSDKKYIKTFMGFKKVKSQYQEFRDILEKLKKEGKLEAQKEVPSKRKKKTAKPQVKGKIPAIVGIIVLVSLCFFSFLAFFLSSEVQGIGNQAMMAIARSPQGESDSTEEKTSCGKGISMLEFDENGNLKEVYPERDNPFPVLETESQLLCAEKIKYTKFISTTGTVHEEDGSLREVTGLTWFAETIAFSTSSDGKNWGHLLPQVKEALTLVLPDENPTLVRIELPGTQGLTPEQRDSQPPPGDADWDETPSVQTTPTAAPPVEFAKIPTRVMVTPFPQVEAANPNAREEEVSSEITQWIADNCVVVYGATDISDLHNSPIWGVTDYVEFNNSEKGIMVLGSHTGENLTRRVGCIPQIIGFVLGGSIDYGGGIVARPKNNLWSQARKVPMYGPGDGKSNGMECYWHNLWFFPCEISYPAEVPSPVPPTLPAPTPSGHYSSFDEYVRVKWTTPVDFGDGVVYRYPTPLLSVSACAVNGTVVTLNIGGGCTHTTHVVDIGDIASLVPNINNFVAARCDLRYRPEGASMEYGDSGVCFGSE